MPHNDLKELNKQIKVYHFIQAVTTLTHTHNPLERLLTALKSLSGTILSTSLQSTVKNFIWIFYGGEPLNNI